MTDTATLEVAAADTEAAARLARVAELQRRRAASARSGAASAPPGPAASAPTAVMPETPVATGAGSSRAGLAMGSKVAATGLGFAAMLGLVGAMGFAARSSATSTPPAPVAPAQVVVVFHPADGSGAATTATSGPAPVAATPSQPIVLSAQPTVRQAPASQAPAGQTNGSR